jgi:hypothetical protein
MNVTVDSNVPILSNVPRLKEDSFQQISIADPKEITAGTIFIKRHTPMPNGFELESKSFSRGWQVLHGMDAHAVEKHLRRNGWSFSFVTPAVIAKAWGLRSNGIVRRSLERVMRQVEELGLNAIEVTSLEVRSFAWLNWVKVAAHPRQLSDSVFLHPFDAKKRDPRVWKPEIFDPYRDLRRKLSLKKYPGMSGR